jgi:hypothetical protein
MEAAGQAVERWFGSGLAQLHPLLQQLHRQGGRLNGRVTVVYGKGLAGWLGRKVATRLGVPPREGPIPLAVHIHSTPQALHWTRVFHGGMAAASIFTPVGAWPDGHWVERIGAISVSLRVDTSHGGWRWVPKRTSLCGVPLPRWLAPRLHASKHAIRGEYHFAVRLAHPLLGTLFSYEGTLLPTGGVSGAEVDQAAAAYQTE